MALAGEEAGRLADRLRAARGDGPESASTLLGGLDGAGWLVLDDVVRRRSRWPGRPRRRPWRALQVAAWRGSEAADVLGGLDGDGYLRQRSVRRLAARPGPAALGVLALRLTDHVPQVREEAAAALLPRLPADPAALVLTVDVLMTARRRRHAGAALDLLTEQLLGDPSPGTVVRPLLRSPSPVVRRWAFALARRAGVLEDGELRAAAAYDRDPQLAVVCARWLVDDLGTQALPPLLASRRSAVRLLTVTGGLRGSVDEDGLSALLWDPARRVRKAARVQALLRGTDVAARCRGGLADEAFAPGRREAALDHLASVGDERDEAASLSHLGHPAARVRTAAVRTVAARCLPAVAVPALRPLLLDASPRVTATVARTLVRLHAPRTVADDAIASDQPWSRRAAWVVRRSGGGWDRLEADLAAASDPDPGLAAQGLTAARAWLLEDGPRTWTELSPARRDRVARLLARSPLELRERRMLAFHAGIADLG